MPQPLISQFERNYNSPIEVNRAVNTVTQRDAIPTLKRWEGMLVYVITDGVTYVLSGGVDNTDWQLFNGISDAPVDGQTYVRKDGAWELLNSTETEVVPFTLTVTDIVDPGTITKNSFRATRVGKLVNIEGIIEVNGVTTTFGTPANALQFTGIPFSPITYFGLQASFMVDYEPAQQVRIARGDISGGALTLNNLSPTTTLNSISIKNNDWVTGANLSRVLLNVSFQID